MGNFQLILLSERKRPIRAARPSDAFSLIQFCSRTKFEMAAERAVEQEITAEELADWFTPMQAWTYAAMIVGQKGATNAIWERLKGGMIDAVAATSSVREGDGNPIATNDPTRIPKQYWQYCSQTGTDLWGAADVRFFIPTRVRRTSSSLTVRCFAIKLNPVDVRATLPPLPPEDQRLYPLKAASENKAPAQVATKARTAERANPGGRPRKEFWDDFWIEICGQIYEGDLKPETQADLERAMLEWVENRGGEVGETTIKAAARKLFKTWKLGVKN